MYELWFRKDYLEDIRNRTLVRAVRPEDRRRPHPKAAFPNLVAKIRIIDIPGSEPKNILPEFLDYQCFVIITQVVVKKIRELKKGDLTGCSSDSVTPELAKLHLEKIYGKKFDDNSTVTVLHWEYIGEKNDNRPD